MTTDPSSKLIAGDALLVVDVQNDFLPGGALPVPAGDAVVLELNRWLAAAREKGLPVFASRDWHPRDHVSFRAQGGEWPTHCVQDTPGAEFAPELALPPETVVLTKGTRTDRDAYSAFQETGLAEQLREAGVGRVWVGGLALDVCVRATCLEARELGLDTSLIVTATRPTEARSGRRTMDELAAAGVVLV